MEEQTQNNLENQGERVAFSDTNTTQQSTSIDPAVLATLKASQRLPAGILGGALGAAVGAATWAIITAISGYQIGYMAIGVGFLTGFAVRKFGQGFEKHFGYIGAVLSLVGCFVGNLLAVLIMLSNQESIPLLEILPQLNLDILISITKDTFNYMDLVFYGIAIYEGYRFSFLTREEITNKLNRIISSQSSSL